MHRERGPRLTYDSFVLGEIEVAKKRDENMNGYDNAKLVNKKQNIWMLSSEHPFTGI